MAGTTSLSLTQQFNELGEPLSGGRLYFITAGTVSTPQNAYQDSALTLPWPNPITLDATGRVVQHFLADGLIKIRLTDENGVVQLVADNLAVIGSSSGGGGGGTIDPTTIYQTGDLKPRYGTGIHTGWVRANARTIGNSLSGATELASDTDAVALYTYLWNTDVNLAISGGVRGASATVDFDAGKTLTLPDFRGVALGFLADMGNTASTRLTSGANGFGTSPIVLGAFGGSESHTLTEVQLAQHTHAFTGTQLADHTHPFVASGTGPGSNVGAAPLPNVNSNSGTTGGVSGGPQTPAGTNSNAGSSGAHNNMPPTKLVTCYIKL